jgi:hypothetical protein
MAPDEPAGPEPSPTTATSVVVGRVRWFGETLRCPECAAAVSRWTLFLAHPSDVAIAQCPGEHRVQHPLFYPAIVRAVIEWSTRPPGQRPGTAAQQFDSRVLRNWQPHYRDDTGAVVVYRDWTQPGAAAVDWSRWPDILAGQQRHEEIQSWLGTASDTDTSATWLLRWGSTDPDVRHIALSPDTST